MSAPVFRPVARPALPRSSAPSSTPWSAGATAAAWALALSVVAVGLPVLLVWASDSRSSAGAVTALKSAGQVWLVAHGVPLRLPSGRLSLVPLGLVLLPLGLLLRAGSQAARQHRVTDLRGAAVLSAAVAGPYAVTAAAVAAVTRTAVARPSVLGALVCAGLLGLVGAGAGVLRTSGVQLRLPPSVPDRLRRLTAPSLVAVLVLLAAGALLGGARLAVAAPRAADLARASAPGAVGGIALLLLGVALVPNAAVWGATWWAGPGFAVGTGTAIGPLAHDLGAVPALPLLAALPSGRLPLALGLLALLVPLVAGAVAGLLVVRAGADRPVADAALCGPLAGAAVGLLAWLSGGAAGGARMAEVGASPWRCALAVAVAVAAGAAVAAWARTRATA